MTKSVEFSIATRGQDAGCAAVTDFLQGKSKSDRAWLYGGSAYPFVS